MEAKEKKLIIYGDSSYAEMIAHYFEEDSAYRVVAFCVDEAYRTREKIRDIPVVARERLPRIYPPSEHALFAAIGYKSVRMHRYLYEKIADMGYPVASYVSSKAIVNSRCQIGENCLILPGVILEPDVQIEENCFVNSGAIVSHHTKIGAHSILAAGSLIGGYCEIGECSLIGFNATVAELLHVASETLLAAGSVLLQDTDPCTMYGGSPAKPLRRHEKDGIVIVPKNIDKKG